MTNEVFNTDCLEYMKSLPDNAFDLAIADPPYGIGAAKMTMGSGKNHKWSKKAWDSNIPTQEFFTQLMRISANQIIWGGVITSHYHSMAIGSSGINSTQTYRLQKESWRGALPIAMYASSSSTPEPPTMEVASIPLKSQ